MLATFSPLSLLLFMWLCLPVSSLLLPKTALLSRYLVLENEAARTRTSFLACENKDKDNLRPQSHQKQLRVEEELAKPRPLLVPIDLDFNKPMANTDSITTIAVARGIVASFLLLGAAVAEASDGSTGKTTAAATVVIKAALPPIVREPKESSESFLHLPSLRFALAQTAKPTATAMTTAATRSPMRINRFDILGRLARIEETSLTKQDAFFGATAFTAAFALVAFSFRAEGKAETKAMEKRMEMQRLEDKVDMKAMRLEDKADTKAMGLLTLFVSIIAVIAPILRS